MRARYLCVVAAVSGACGDPTTTKLPDWQKTLPPATVMNASAARGIVHLHSPYSHDACDGNPRDATGAPDETCLGHLRAALCADRIDFAALTDHDGTMADEEFPTLFNMRGTDSPVMRAADQVGSQIHCDNGHTVTVTVGGENDLMPIMLDRHVPGTIAERHSIYNGTSAGDIQAMRDAGALIWIAHTEQHPIDELRTVLPDGIEVYNLHANIDPDIRRDFLGLDAAGAISKAVEFADTNEGGPEPDLALLAFVSPNAPAIERWNQLLADGHKIPATAGSDAHENALPIMLADGERGDSYRRVLRWFSNVVFATPGDPAAIKAALKSGGLFAVFELFGTPEGFAVEAQAAGGPSVGIGDAVAAPATIRVQVPAVRALDPSLPAPEIHATVFRIDAGGATVVGMGSGPSIEVQASTPGAYRVEVSIVPRHLGPYLRDLGTTFADREVPWIYASPIYVE